MLLLVALGKMIKSKYCRYQYKAIRSSPKTFHSAKDYSIVQIAGCFGQVCDL